MVFVLKFDFYGLRFLIDIKLKAGVNLYIGNECDLLVVVLHLGFWVEVEPF